MSKASADAITYRDVAGSKAPSVWIVAFAAWLVPGAGHLLQRKWLRGGLFFTCVTLFFWLAVGFQAHFTMPSDAGESFALFKYISQVCAGINYVAAWGVGLTAVDPTSLKQAMTNEIATTFLYTAGIVNVLTAVDAVDIRLGRKS